RPDDGLAVANKMPTTNYLPTRCSTATGARPRATMNGKRPPHPFTLGRCNSHAGLYEESQVTHFVIKPVAPPEISVATLAKIIGKRKPPGDARNFGSQTGSNLSL